MKRIETCIVPGGSFQYGIHKPAYTVTNLRPSTKLETLGLTEDNDLVKNERNYPQENLEVTGADWIFEIPNPFPFKGRTYIDKEWADASANNPERISLPQPQDVSLCETLQQNKIEEALFEKLPAPLLLALATCSTDPLDLIKLAELSCDILKDCDTPTGLRYSQETSGPVRPIIHNHALFEAVANNPHLPDEYKIVMVIRPGAQGGSEIVGEWPKDEHSHVFEYLRRNSYIPGGHYAANMADDAIRYSIDALSTEDIRGLRHLYYQRSYVRLAEELGLNPPNIKAALSEKELETLRLALTSPARKRGIAPATLWGWNFGFDFAPSSYRLHASHQQIHQQYALVADQVECYHQGTKQSVGQMSAYCCGDLVAELIEQYRLENDSDFFEDYRRAITGNQRMDDRTDLESGLVVWSDEKVMLFVPKAQTSQWELQLMTLPAEDGSLAGNIFECDSHMRHSLDTGILMAQKALAGIGAKMVTSIEYSKRMTTKSKLRQPLLYAFLPRLPESPGAFSEAQLRFINGHYPEDFATACKNQII
ncbi:MAG: hypothetical protein GY799_07320 [Desulfobulbaceae bacterium]|nr:hypothetical protein [Desulfobulbaceae bacterium]